PRPCHEPVSMGTVTRPVMTDDATRRHHGMRVSPREGFHEFRGDVSQARRGIPGWEGLRCSGCRARVASAPVPTRGGGGRGGGGAGPRGVGGLEPESLKGLLDRDEGVEENRDFPYRILAPAGCERSGRGVLLLHGLNERRWEKYLPWAKALVEGLGVPVILF